MDRTRHFFIDGRWVEPLDGTLGDVVNPATEEVIAQIVLGSAADVDRAVEAARRAFPSFSRVSREDRLALLGRISAVGESRREELAQAITAEMGSPITFARELQAVVGLSHFGEMAKVLAAYEFEHAMRDTLLRREPIGVCGLITPWNWPLHQVTAKLAPAIAAGCTVVVKPSEVAPLSSLIFMEILSEAGLPDGVVNLVNGAGATVGDAIARHRGIDMVSFTGSTSAGILVAQAAAENVKRVVQELGGKSPNIILRDANLPAAVQAGVARCFANSGQSCQAPSRMLVHRSQQDQAFELARATVAQMRVGDPLDPETTMGPVVSRAQYDRVQSYIERGIEEGASLICGGPGRGGRAHGFYVEPTVFGDVTPDMTIAREEIFGPVLSIMPYDTEEEAIEVANDTSYGLAAYVQGGDIDRVREIAFQLRAGRVHLNGAPHEPDVPMGGYKQSGNGRELGREGFEEYLELKAILGYGNPAGRS